MVNLFYDSYRILTKIYSEKAFIKQAISSEVIEPINKNAVIKICYGVVDNDIYLEYLINKLCDKRPKLPIRILLKISIYCINFLNKAPYAVTDSAVELCKKLGKGGMSGFLNAILRKYIKLSKSGQINLPNEPIKYLSVKYSFPEFVVKRLINDYGYQTAEQIMSHEEVYTFLRFNSGVDGEEYLNNIGYKFEKTCFSNLYALKNFTREEGFFQGKYTFQSIGSVAICSIVEGGKSLIDTCAAPGGKSVALSNKFENITSCELHPHRAKLIEDYALRMGSKNINVVINDATRLNEDFLNKYDAVLCDVPCSGFGVTKENPDIKLNREQENLEQLNKTQLQILTTCANYLKQGGYIYYSTCSVLKEENSEIISQFLSSNTGFEVVDIDCGLPHVKDKFGLQFLPHLSMGAGFYICKMRKI